MLRMGKNPKGEAAEAEHTTDNPNAQYNSSRNNYAPYQATETPQARMSSDSPSGGARAVSESENLARDIKDGNLSGFVGNGTVLTGEATFKMMLRVDGHLSGRVSSDDGTLIVGNNGQVDANIEVAIATIHGTVNGDIIATQRLELGRAAKVNGNIQTPSLVIEQGAVFEGSCRMTQSKADYEKRETQARKGNGASTLDASSMEPVATESATTTSDFSSISASEAAAS